MVQAMDNSINRPIYNAVKINISKPAVNKGETDSISDDNGIYNAVDINIDKPRVNQIPKSVYEQAAKAIYDYPYATSPVTYDMAQVNQIPMPQGFHMAYQTTNVILPNIENNLNIDDVEEVEIETDDNDTPININAEKVEAPDVPAPNYTTVEAEKAEVELEDIDETEESEEVPEEISIPDEEDEVVDDNIENDVEIMEAETAEIKNIKRPEIIPGEDILPDVDIPLVVSNLTNPDFDVQAAQMEEIARLSMNNPEDAVSYIVRDVFTSLIDITKKDTANLATPTEEQIEARKKIIANVLTLENSNPQGEVKLPFKLSEKEIALANEISPMEQAERNKEYALYTIAILAKVYTDEIEKHTGNIVPMTDIPGVSDTVDALRYNPNAGVKIAAIDALRHISRPEYKEELTTVFTLAQADTNPQVALSAQRAIENLNN